MMKKIKFLPLIICSLFSLCSCNVGRKVFIESGYGVDSPIELTKEEFESKLADRMENGKTIDGDSFLLIVTEQSCTACIDFSSVLNDFIKRTKTLVYTVDSSIANELIKTNTSLKACPRLVIYDRGKVYNQTNVVKNPGVFENEFSFKRYINKYCTISPFKSVTDAQLDEIIKTSGIVYYGWSSCGDCTFLDRHYLLKYSKHNHPDNLYYFDVADYRKYKTKDGNGPDEQIWNDFLERTGLNINGNRGVVPTFIYYNNGKVVDHFIYLNDEYEVTTLGMVLITNSIHGDNLNGRKFASYDDYQRQCSIKNNYLLKEFLDKYSIFIK